MNGNQSCGEIVVVVEGKKRMKKDDGRVFIEIR